MRPARGQSPRSATGSRSRRRRRSRRFPRPPPWRKAFTDPGWPGALWIYGGDDPTFKIYANQWYFANINGTWYGGAGEWLYRGAPVCKAGQGTKTIGPDSGFGNPFKSWVPRQGELVGFAVSASARALPAMATVQEGTDV